LEKAVVKKIYTEFKNNKDELIKKYPNINVQFIFKRLRHYNLIEKHNDKFRKSKMRNKSKELFFEMIENELKEIKRAETILKKDNTIFNLFSGNDRYLETDEIKKEKAYILQFLLLQISKLLNKNLNNKYNVKDFSDIETKKLIININTNEIYIIEKNKTNERKIFLCNINFNIEEL